MEMAKKLVVVLVVIMMVTESSRAVSLCNMNDNGVSACKPYVKEPTKEPPSAECCKAVAASDLKCFCKYLSSPWLPAFGVDPDLALALPSKCNPPIHAEC